MEAVTDVAAEIGTRLTVVLFILRWLDYLTGVCFLSRILTGPLECAHIHTRLSRTRQFMSELPELRHSDGSL